MCNWFRPKTFVSISQKKKKKKKKKKKITIRSEKLDIIAHQITKLTACTIFKEKLVH